MTHFIEKDENKMPPAYLDGLKKPERVCPICNARGYFFKDFNFEGKDEDELLHFKCHNCNQSFIYDALNGSIEAPDKYQK